MTTATNHHVADAAPAALPWTQWRCMTDEAGFFAMSDREWSDEMLLISEATEADGVLL